MKIKRIKMKEPSGFVEQHQTYQAHIVEVTKG